jgi:Zn-dependent protease
MTPDSPTPLLPEPTPSPFEPVARYEPAPIPGLQGDPGAQASAFGEQRQSFFKRRIAPIGAALVALLAKLKTLLLLLPKGKVLITAGSMIVSIAAYGSIWGIPFAIGFVILLLIHETGHVIALRREGIKASPPMFIPFLGAVISARSLGDNALAEARVGLAGPILGSIGAAACIPLWHATGNDYWQALAYTGLFLNLFNLLPVVPLDGGRAMAAMTPWLWLAGFGAMIVLALTFPNPIIWIIVLLSAFETYNRFKQRRAGGDAQRAYYRVAPRDRATIAAVYIGLIVLLVVGMNATHLHASL